MAAILPNPFKLKSNNNDRYLRLHDGKFMNQDGILEFAEEDSNPVFTTENAKIPGYVHIKHSVTGKYLTRAPRQTGPPLKIVATADAPNETKTDENCTLFESENVGPNTPTQVVFRMIHVQSKFYIMPYLVGGLDAVLCAVSDKKDPNGVADVLTAIGQR